MPDYDRHANLVFSTDELARRVDDFLREALRDKSADTVGTYRRALNEFQRWFHANSGACRFRPEDIGVYKNYLTMVRGLQQVSISTYLTALRRFMQYLVDIGLLYDNPAQNVRGNRRPIQHTRETLTTRETGQLLESLDSESQMGKRDQAIVYLMLFSGLSEVEIARADIQDLEQTLMGWYLRIQGKGRSDKDQQVQVDSHVMDIIRLYLDTRRRIRPDAPLFVSHGHRSEGRRLNTRTIRNRIAGCLHQAGITRTGVTPHSLTHTAAVIWLKDGVSVEEVQRRMRHGTLNTTMIYYSLVAKPK